MALAIFILIPGKGWVATIFSENMVSPSGTTPVPSNTFQNSATLAFSGTGDVRTTIPSTGYTGASGGGNVWLTTTSGTYTFIISGINTSIYTDIALTFGSSASTTGGKPTVEYSTDGTNYTALTISANVGTSWGLVSPTGSIPPTSNLYLRFSKSGSIGFRIDDVVLTGTSTVTPTKLAFTTVPSNATAGNTFSVTVQAQDASNNAGPVSANTAFNFTTNGNAGSIGGTTSGTITTGQTSVTVTGVTMTNAGSGVTLTATRSSGDNLSAGTSNAFTVFNTIPAAASVVTFVSKTNNSISISWSNGNGTGRIVVARANATAAVAPSLGTAYAVNSASFSDVVNPLTGTGNIVVYNGTGNSLTITGLTSSTAYNFDVYEYNGSAPTINYSSVASLGSTSTLASEPTTQASSIGFASVTKNTFTINWTSGSGSSRLILLKAGSAVDANPIDGAAAYTSNAAFSTGSQIGTGNYVVYSGSGTSVPITGLSGGTTYYVAIFEFNGSGATSNYLTPSTSTGSQATSNDYISLVSTATTTSENFYGMTTGTILPSGFLIGEKGSTGWSSGVVAVTQVASSGSPNTGGTYNFGNSVTTSDRAVGAITSGSWASPNSIMAKYRNNTGTSISSLVIAFNLERYRINSTVASISFFYSLDGTNWTSVTSGDIASGSIPTGTNSHDFNPSGTPS